MTVPVSEWQSGHSPTRVGSSASPGGADTCPLVHPSDPRDRCRPRLFLHFCPWSHSPSWPASCLSGCSAPSTSGCPPRATSPEPSSPDLCPLPGASLPGKATHSAPLSRLPRVRQLPPPCPCLYAGLSPAPPGFSPSVPTSSKPRGHVPQPFTGRGLQGGGGRKVIQRKWEGIPTQAQRGEPEAVLLRK